LVVESVVLAAVHWDAELRAAFILKHHSTQTHVRDRDGLSKVDMVKQRADSTKAVFKAGGDTGSAPPPEILMKMF